MTGHGDPDKTLPERHGESQKNRNVRSTSRSQSDFAAAPSYLPEFTEMLLLCSLQPSMHVIQVLSDRLVDLPHVIPW